MRLKFTKSIGHNLHIRAEFSAHLHSTLLTTLLARCYYLKIFYYRLLPAASGSKLVAQTVVLPSLSQNNTTLYTICYQNTTMFYHIRQFATKYYQYPLYKMNIIMILVAKLTSKMRLLVNWQIVTKTRLFGRSSTNCDKFLLQCINNLPKVAFLTLFL